MPPSFTPKPSPWLIANNIAMAAVGAFATLRAFQTIQDAPGPAAVATVLVGLALLALTAVLQFRGTFLAAEWSAAAAGVICSCTAALAGVAAPGLLFNDTRDGAGVALIAAYAAVSAMLNLRRNDELYAPPPKGLCPACGYDCRATPDRCPECGRIMRTVPAPPPDEDEADETEGFESE